MKITTKLTLCDEPTAAAFEKAIAEALLVPNTKSLLILANDADQWDPDKLNPILTSQNVPIFGGIFPYLIYAGKRLNQGTIIVGLNITPELVVIENLSKGREAIIEQLELNCSVIKKEKSLVTIVDGLAENVERFIEGLYGITGQDSVAIGCGAGGGDFIQKPCLFSNNGMICDAAMVAGIPTPYSLGLSHGWEVLGGPYLVTQSKGKILEALNYAPAFDVYREHIEKSVGLNFDEHDFYDIAKTYPLGIENMEGEMLVRAPLLQENKSLIFVGEVPENSVIYLLKGEKDSLIAAAGIAAKTAYGSHPFVDNNDLTALLFNCVSRPLFLGDDFDKELKAIEVNLNGHSEFFGALTLGEIGNSKNGPIEWLNNSTVIAVF